jgi:hypothetical protein
VRSIIHTPAKGGPLIMFIFSPAQLKAIKDALMIAYVDDDAPIYETEEGIATILELGRMFDIAPQAFPFYRT